MPLNNLRLLSFLDELLQPERIKDFCPNGLQIEGKSSVSKLVSGVTASQALIDRAIALEADAIFVHHGYFWKGEDPTLRGMKKRRLQSLLAHDINLFAYHLPLDVHPQLGNNAQLANLLNIEVEGGLEAENPVSVALSGHFKDTITVSQLARTIELKLGRTPLIEGDDQRKLSSVAWCTGGGQNYIEMAAEQGIDVFITGEVSEKTIHTAREMDICFVAAGHHATERYGAKAIAEHLSKHLDLDTEFVDIDNPA